MASFIKQVQNFAFQNNLWERDSRIIIGVSGGPDSACLLHVMNILAKKNNFILHIAHVNYDLRGKDSEKDEIFVKKLGEKYGIEVSVLRPKKIEYPPVGGGNLENCLRDIRYSFFEKLRKDLNFDLIAVAHNQNDQAETVLMKIIRGTGLSGMRAMKAKNYFLIRPLLGTSRKDILAYLKENRLKYRIDKTNSENVFTRNKTRNSLIPYIEKNFNSSLVQNLANLSNIVADDYEIIAEQAEKFAGIVCKNKCAQFSVKEFILFPCSIQRQVLRTLIIRIKENEHSGLGINQVEEILKIVNSAKDKSQKALIGGLKISKKGDTVEIFC